MYSNTQSDHILVQNELEKLELDTSSEKTSLENSLLVMKNQMTKKQ